VILVFRSLLITRHKQSLEKLERKIYVPLKDFKILKEKLIIRKMIFGV